MENLDVNKIMFEIESSLDTKGKSAQRLQDLFAQNQISGCVYDLLHLAKLKKKLFRYKLKRNVWYAKVCNLVLSVFYKILFSVLDPVISSQEMFNRRFVEELIKLKNK
jgi:hypothetical protein